MPAFVVPAAVSPWSQDTTVGEAYSSLNSAASSINEMFIAISEDISEPFVLKNKDYSMSERYHYSQTTRDSKTRSRISFTKYREGMEKYEYEINEFDK